MAASGGGPGDAGPAGSSGATRLVDLAELATGQGVALAPGWDRPPPLTDAERRTLARGGSNPVQHLGLAVGLVAITVLVPVLLRSTGPVGAAALWLGLAGGVLAVWWLGVLAPARRAAASLEGGPGPWPALVRVANVGVGRYRHARVDVCTGGPSALVQGRATGPVPRQLRDRPVLAAVAGELGLDGGRFAVRFPDGTLVLARRYPSVDPGPGGS